MKRGAIGVSAGIAALLLTAGCDQNRSLSARQEGEQVPASQVAAQAHQRAGQAFDQARDAQKEAVQQQRQATRAQEEVQEARQKLVNAQNRAQQELQEAQEAQKQAQRQTQAAEQTVAAAQSSALEAQRQQQAELVQQAQQPVVPAATQGAQFIDGEVLTVNAQELLVSVRGEPQLRLQLVPNTQLFVNGRQARASEIEEGSQVRASYQDVGGEPQAVRVEVTTSQQPVRQAAPESGESTPGAVGP
jgi:colicin import membrane protein